MTPDHTAALKQAVGKLAEICAMMCDILADIERRGADREQRPLNNQMHDGLRYQSDCLLSIARQFSQPHEG